MALIRQPNRALQIIAAPNQNRDGFAPVTRIIAAFLRDSLMQAFDFIRISASVPQGRSQVACTSSYVSNEPDKQTTRNSICPLSLKLPSLSPQSLFQHVANNKKKHRSMLSRSQHLLNWANTLSGRASRAPFPIATLNRGCV